MPAKSTGELIGFGFSDRSVRSLVSATPSTRLMRALNLWGSCSWLGERKGSWLMNGWLLVFLSKMCCHKASWARTTCGISGCSKGSPVCYRQLVVRWYRGVLV